MTDFPLVKFDGSRPFCEVCKRPVEYLHLATPIREARGGGNGIRQMENTGEKIITVSCHGETWAFSNWRGRVAPDPNIESRAP